MLTFEQLINGERSNPNIATADILAEIQSERIATNRRAIKNDLTEMMVSAETTIKDSVGHLRAIRKQEKEIQNRLSRINLANNYMISTGNPYPLYAIINPWLCSCRLRENGFWDENFPKLEDQPLVKMV